jgi:hypothetical protein
MTVAGWAMEIHAPATWFMAGVIWIMQLVHYPMFRSLDRTTFSASHHYHSRSISIIVMPVMVIEIGLASLLCWNQKFLDVQSDVALALLLVNWATTFFVIVPLHDRLRSNGFQDDVHASLLRWNWVRTIGWTARGLIVLLGTKA